MCIYVHIVTLVHDRDPGYGTRGTVFWSTGDSGLPFVAVFGCSWRWPPPRLRSERTVRPAAAADPAASTACPRISLRAPMLRTRCRIRRRDFPAGHCARFRRLHARWARWTRRKMVGRFRRRLPAPRGFPWRQCRWVTGERIIWHCGSVVDDVRYGAFDDEYKLIGSSAQAAERFADRLAANDVSANRCSWYNCGCCAARGARGATRNGRLAPHIRSAPGGRRLDGTRQSDLFLRLRSCSHNHNAIIIARFFNRCV